VPACVLCVSSFIGQRTLGPALNPSVSARSARTLELSQIKHGRDPETTARGSLESLSPLFSLFGYTCDRLFVDGSGDICASGSPLSPFSRVSSYRYANTSNLQRTTLRPSSGKSRGKHARARTRAIVLLSRGAPYRNQLSASVHDSKANARYVKYRTASPRSCRAVNQGERGEGGEKRSPIADDRAARNRRQQDSRMRGRL